MVCLPFSLLLITEVDFIRKVDIGEKNTINAYIGRAVNFTTAILALLANNFGNISPNNKIRNVTSTTCSKNTNTGFSKLNTFAAKKDEIVTIPTFAKLFDINDNDVHKVV